MSVDGVGAAGSFPQARRSNTAVDNVDNPRRVTHIAHSLPIVSDWMAGGRSGGALRLPRNGGGRGFHRIVAGWGSRKQAVADPRKTSRRGRVVARWPTVTAPATPPEALRACSSMYSEPGGLPAIETSAAPRRHPRWRSWAIAGSTAVEFDPDLTSVPRTIDWSAAAIAEQVGGRWNVHFTSMLSPWKRAVSWSPRPTSQVLSLRAGRWLKRVKLLRDWRVVSRSRASSMATRCRRFFWPRQVAQ